MPVQSLQAKLALAVASIAGYWLLYRLFEQLELSDSFPNAHLWIWFRSLVGIVFGALVLAPYVGSRQRIWRVLALCGTSVLIYFLAERFVADGPLGYETIAPFLVSGGGAALLVGLAVIVLAPQHFSWKLILLTLVAGALGGAAFQWNPEFFDHTILPGHAAWQLLVCLALHFGFRKAPA